MIDLRKPLEGVPGLLLMAALIFFGATIGIAVAICFTWIPMSGELANFLGGVVGAGLGAALAVGGAVYVQRRDARERLTAPINRLRQKSFELDMLASSLNMHLKFLDYSKGEYPEECFRGVLHCHAAIVNLVEELPESAELPRDVHNLVHNVRRYIPSMLGPVYDYAMANPAWGQVPKDHSIALREAAAVADTLAQLHGAITRL